MLSHTDDTLSPDLANSFYLQILFEQFELLIKASWKALKSSLTQELSLEVSLTKVEISKILS